MEKEKFDPGPGIVGPDGLLYPAPYEEARQKRLREQADKNKEQADRAMVRVTFASVVVAVVAALAALWSGYEAHQTRLEDERPFLAVDLKHTQPVQPNLGRLGNFEVSLVAFGKTPARNVHFSCATQLNVGRVTTWNNFKSHFGLSFRYILPSRSEGVFCESINASKAPPPGGGGDYVVYGVASYEDESHHHFQTPFCDIVIEIAPDSSQFLQCQTDFRLPELK